ncbi:SDR family oxidoreductase [Myroides albus]|uniref:SDR family oxidoreductase n=1 Tax=Myroides albus TaxID=2562892 RepID=UPI0021597862|nr:SDR family oxidoreductase [Myroides albus]UVD79589.1 SDR family oxidoreductase [Myroides albus]
MSKVVFITGGSSGIGKCVGEYLTLKGFKVYGTSRNPERVVGSKFPLVQLDVRDKVTIVSAIAEVVAKEGRIDILINNAGVGITGPIEEIPTDEIINNFQTNVFGPIEVIKAALPTMRNQKGGLIINVTSIAGYMGLPFRGIYSSSKSALEMITEALRMELKPFKIEVTNVAPGDFATNIAAGRYHAPVLQDSPYKDVYQMSLDMANTHVDSGNNPMEMAEAIFKIINTKKPKVRYKVGEKLQKFSLFLKKVLPSKTYEKLLMNHYKIKK